MKRSTTLIIAACAIALLAAGCTSIPQGFTPAQWQSLSPKQQAKYLATTQRDRQGFSSDITSARSDADSTLSRLNPTQSTLSPDPSSTR